jgi:hypothetical protein
MPDLGISEKDDGNSLSQDDLDKVNLMDQILTSKIEELGLIFGTKQES